MTSISSTSNSWQWQSPSQLLQNQLQSDVSTGQISSTDATALTSALDSINTSLQQGASSTSTSTTSTTPPSAEDMQSKISSLIDAQVSSGQLTANQASELKDVFQQTFQGNGQTGVQGAHHGHGHHHHSVSSTSTDDTTDPTDPDNTDPLTADPSSSTASTDPSNIGAVTSSSSSGSTGDSTQQLVDQFLQSLQQAASTGYGAAGTTTASSNASALLVDFSV